MENNSNTWEQVYEDLQTKDYKDVLDVEFESGRYYELPWMISHFRSVGDTDKEQAMIDLHLNIEKIEGRKIAIGDKFLLDTKTVNCTLEIVDIDENNVTFIEYTNVNYKTDKREITQDFNINDLPRIY